jgi:hypothetical protein
VSDNGSTTTTYMDHGDMAGEVITTYRGMSKMTYTFNKNGTYTIEIPGLDMRSGRCKIDKKKQTIIFMMEGGATDPVSYSFINGELIIVLEEGVWQRLRKLTVNN